MTSYFGRFGSPPEEIGLPERCYITPSKPNNWRGGKDKDARFTRAQLGVMEQLGMDPATTEVVVVRSTATYREEHVGSGPQPIYVMPCPVLEHRPNGFRLVISPSGYRDLVHESGDLSIKKGRGRV
ncbi:hypothetical protein [Sphingomonas montanisoli]|uniref:Uncharacterized protein n=1 Tax=Sphingomonas montanisoli TaxID=2606412 RepID=A0A5D9C132_9SPHN|nr:hypothetical protein [Sphingomonas montanisoli]TZG24897.1 hypothetical protein FYJ91_16590 [Sphingomonas montanisoli]